MKKYISIIPDLKGGAGHMFTYHQAFGKSVKINKSEHFVLFYSNITPEIYKSNWRNVLEIGVLEMSFRNLVKSGNIIRSAVDVIKFAHSISKGIGSIEHSRNDKLVLFIERFNALQLAGFMLSSVFKSKKIFHLLILFRHDQYSFGNSRYIYKLLVVIINIFCNLVIVTDSDILARNLRNFFGHKVSTVPIPMSKTRAATNKSDNSIVKIWWPGGARINKGWDILKEILGVFSQRTVKKNIRFVVSNSSGLHHLIQQPHIEILDDVLSIESYYEKFNEINIVLLPYSRNDYRASTSGIFVEAIILGKVPFVTDGTWMSSELRKYDLMELVIDWARPEALDIVLERYNSKDIQGKLKIMQEYYKSYHSVDNFSKIISSLI